MAKDPHQVDHSLPKIPPKGFLTPFGGFDIFKPYLKARSSAGERCLDAAEVGGSKPPAPTI